MKENIKTSNHVIDAIKEVTKDFFIVLFIVIVPLFISLKIGIKINRLSFHHYNLEGLYIKLDKKFILKAKKIHIPKTKAKPSFGSVEKTFNNIKEVLNYFEYIELKNIEFENNNLTILYADDTFYISTKDYAISSIVHKNKYAISATITNLHINKSDIDINGTLVYTFKDDILKTQGHFFFLDSDGSFSMIKDHKNLSLSLGSSHFTKLKKLLQPWEIPQYINVWIVDKVKAKRYKLDYFKISASLDNHANIVPNFHSINAKATLSDVDIHFQEGIDCVKSKQVQILYQDNNLSFILDNPTYKDRDINGSKVVISNLVGKKKAILGLDLYIHSKIDKVVHNILKSYHISLPLSSDTTQYFYIKLDKPLYQGSDIKVYVESNLSKDRFYISKVPLDITSGYVSMQDSIIKLSDIKLKNSIYNIISNGTVDIQKRDIKLQNHIKSLVIKDINHKDIVHIKKSKLPIYMTYGTKFNTNIPKLSIKLQTYKNKTTIHLDKLAKILPYIKNIPLKIFDGKMDISTKDFQKYNFAGMLKWSECFFYTKDNACLSNVPCSGQITKKGFILNAFGKKLYINNKKSVIKLNNLNIDIDKFFQVNLKNLAKQKKKIYIYGNNSTIRYKEYHLLTDSYDISIYPNGNIKAIGSLDKDVVKFDKKGKDISIKAYRVKDKMLHPLINFNGLKQGRYTLKLEGDPNKKLKGEILVEGGVLKDFKTYNNTLAFINSIPALATFSNPGFSDKGYVIKEGMIEYTKTKDKIYLDSIYIKGSSANIAGKGIIDIKTKAINISLAVQVAKDFSKVISKIPLVGYILMGDDESMTLGLKITGNLNKPIIKTSVAKDILSLPFRMLKRTFGG